MGKPNVSLYLSGPNSWLRSFVQYHVFYYLQILHLESYFLYYLFIILIKHTKNLSYLTTSRQEELKSLSATDTCLFSHLS